MGGEGAESTDCEDRGPEPGHWAGDGWLEKEREPSTAGPVARLLNGVPPGETCPAKWRVAVIGHQGLAGALSRLSPHPW